MNKYLKDIFIHLDGIPMAAIYELIKSKKIDSKNVSEAYTNILNAVLKAQKISYSEIECSPYDFSGIKDYYAAAVELIQINKINKKLHGQVINSFGLAFNKVYLNYLEALQKQTLSKKVRNYPRNVSLIR